MADKWAEYIITKLKEIAKGTEEQVDDRIDELLDKYDSYYDPDGDHLVDLYKMRELVGDL